MTVKKGAPMFFWSSVAQTLQTFEFAIDRDDCGLWTDIEIDYKNNTKKRAEERKLPEC